MTKFFKKPQKPYFGAIWAFCAQIWTKFDFSGKKESQFLNDPIIYHCAKNQKKSMCHS